MSDAVPSVPGLRLAVASAGIRYRNRADLVLIELAAGSTTAAVFTRNAFCAAPVIVAREHLAATAPRYWLINAGNANAGTGAAGLRASREICGLLAGAAGCALQQVLPFSTGVIGEDLPIQPFAEAIPRLLAGLSPDNWPAAAAAIMTTDTVPKLASRQIEIAGRPVRLTGMTKGSGMICPDMATMLAFIATDAEVPREVLQKLLADAVGGSFNAITIDGDTSTNDACVLAATARSGVRIGARDSSEYELFGKALAGLCLELATAMVRDGEGATKLVTVRVEAARDPDEARQVAYTVAHSPLVKTALFAGDPNWGRILAAVGRAGLLDLDIDTVRIWLDEVSIVRAGGRDPDYTEQAGRAVMSKPELTIRIALQRGTADAQVLTCDFSYDYVKINAEYRS